MIACQIEDQYWKIKSKIHKKNFTYHNVRLMEGIIEFNAIPVIAGVYIRIRVSQFPEHPRRIVRQIVTQSRLPVDL